MHTILVANRGEIACRIIRTARAEGYKTVAVFSDADSDAPHVAAADLAVAIGGTLASESYLCIDKILDAAARTGADAIHPGYGFLSERSEFARACADAGLTFIGPPAAAIELMGNKAAAKRKMIAAGVPCVPGYHASEGSPDDATLAAAAERVGYPLLVKAAAGGGGRGMRLVERAEDLPAALQSARSEAGNAFGSDELLLERAIVNGRHIEIQVFADTHGQTIHLGERDCSVQRRHQKVVEEAPSPAVDELLRARMGAAAVDAAAAIGYVGAGTVEFLLGDDGEFYFLEMNTRLQVEHPVTELVYGVDLVAWQLAIAEGAPLPFDQSQVEANGHAIEVRLYAEDPYAGYLPQSGPIALWEPACAAGVRIDHGIRSGLAVTPYYDPMVAKVIAHGASREQARRRLCRALERSVLLGLRHNRGFLIDVLSHKTFISGGATTQFLDHAGDELTSPRIPPPLVWAAAALAWAMRGQTNLDGWRTSTPLQSTLELQCGDKRAALQWTIAAGGIELSGIPQADAATHIRPHSRDGAWLWVEHDGIRQQICTYIDSDEQIHVHVAQGSFILSRPPPAQAADEAQSGTLRAPTGGRVLAVHVGVGDEVTAGQALVVLEAMKIETTIAAPFAGKVVEVAAKAGGQVRQRSVLVTLAPHAKTAD